MGNPPSDHKQGTPAPERSSVRTATPCRYSPAPYPCSQAPRRGPITPVPNPEMRIFVTSLVPNSLGSSLECAVSQAGSHSFDPSHLMTRHVRPRLLSVSRGVHGGDLVTRARGHCLWKCTITPWAKPLLEAGLRGGRPPGAKSSITLRTIRNYTPLARPGTSNLRGALGSAPDLRNAARGRLGPPGKKLREKALSTTPAYPTEAHKAA